jgi:hypothetical protein
MQPMATPEAVPGSVHFSLFESDGLHRLYARLHIGRFAPFRLLKRCALALLLTWIPVALLALMGPYSHHGWVATNFFADFAAYAQFLIAMPLFVLAEPVVDASTRGAAKQFIACGTIRSRDRPRLYGWNAQIALLRKSIWSDLTCLVIAYVLSLVILVPEFGNQPTATWHVADYHLHFLKYNEIRTLTPAGAWEFLVALPILNYTWLRFVWKILLWTYYLNRVSRLNLQLHPTHADLVGGIGFVSNTQGHFALFILAYGISNIAATVGYEITILHYDFSTTSVWGPVVGFAVGAPLLFTLPLFMFTKQLYRSKRRALAAYRQRVTEHSRAVETRWLGGRRDEQSAPDEIRDLTELSTLGTMFTRIESMRVVPFDLVSFAQLAGSSLGSLATLLPILHVGGNVTGVFDALSKVLGHVGGH